ncbi:hypothetical protein MACK_000889 [Theileria orientalis]|uniref:HAD-superfamily hydrolase, subfamily IIB protein n=1 Tax=Theileria orientalis TaxID=68886 RepID=A0A976MAF3_THEOR|nr:hypothetical protein MACK_000889 [Theileria orientalis]
MQYIFRFKDSISIILLYSLLVKSDEIANFVKPTTLPKYFAVDVDGTFFVHDPTTFKKNIDAFKLLKEKNITPFFCTGTDRPSNKNLLGDSFFNETGYDGTPGIYANGALVYGNNGTLVKMEKFSEAFLEKFKDHMTNNGLNSRTIYTTEDKLFVIEKIADDVLNYLKLIKYIEPTQITFDELKTKNVVTIVFNSDNFQMEGATENTDYTITYPNKGVAQITPPGCNKKSALKALLDHLKSNAHECAYIGDGVNDIPGFELCDLSFAVGNAKDEVKQKAKWVLDLNYDQGAFEKVVKLLVEDQQ